MTIWVRRLKRIFLRPLTGMSALLPVTRPKAPQAV